MPLKNDNSIGDIYLNLFKHNIMRVTIQMKSLYLIFNKTLGMGKEIYNRIKAVLAEKGKTNNWLSEQLDMNRTTISKWCRNEMQPRVETLFQIADVLNIDVRELLIKTKE